MGAVFDGEAFGKTIVEAVNASIDRAIGPLVKRLDALEVAQQECIRSLEESDNHMIESVKIQVDTAWTKSFGIDAVDVAVSKAMVEFEPRILMAVDKAVEAIPAPINGKDADPIDMDAVRSMIVEECKDVRAALESTIGPEMQTALSIMVTEAFKAIPVPVAPELPDIAGMITDAVSKAVDMEALKTEIVSQVQVERVELEKALAVDVPLMVKNSVDALPKPADGKSVTVDDVKPLLVDLVKEAVAEIDIPVPADGKSVTVDDVRPILVDLVKEAAAAIPVPADGKSVTVDDVRPLIDDAVSKAVEAIPVPKDGKDADPVDMEAVQRQVDDVIGIALKRYEAAIAAIPVPADGKSVTVDDVRPLIDDAVSKAVSAIPVPQNGKDGADAVDCFVDKRGHLIVTFSTGKTKDVGQVVGNDGVDCDIDGVWKLINEKLDSWPKPKDGLGFDDMAVEYDGERTIKFVLVRENERKEFAFDLPIPLYQGLFSDGKSYAKGDSVTFDGSVWIAQIDNATKKPGENNSEWRLAVKRGKAGRNGADAVLPEKKPVQLGV